jgi:hypothetical protein
VSLQSFFSSTSLCGMNFCQIFLFCKYSCRIGWIVFLLMFNSFTIILSPLTILYHHLSDICYCVCISRGRRTPAPWMILKIFMPIFELFKSFRYTAVTWGFITPDSLQYVVSFSWCFI